MRKTLFLIPTLFFALTCFSVPIGFAQSGDSDLIVKLIYFLPRGNTPQSDIDTKLDVLVKEVQGFYADEMERHGFGRKTFRLETDRRGTVVVHHVNGRFTNAYYRDETEGKIWEEIDHRFDRSQNIYLVVTELSGETNLCGTGSDRGGGGQATIPASGGCFSFYVIAHELGHAFGLEHDFHSDAYIMSFGWTSRELSPCHAEWLDVHRYFNTTRSDFNPNAEIEMLPPAASPPYAVRLRFAITDPDELHQAQFLTPATDPLEGPGFPKVLSCKSLRGQSDTVEFVTTELIEGPASQIMLQVMDVHGNFTWHEFPIDVTRLLPRGKVVAIPDPNLVAVVKETLELPLRTPITQLDMLKLTSIMAPERQITDLTGLEHAKNLKSLKLGENQIRDVTPLTGLTQLKFLALSENQISDIRPLAGLLHLTDLNLVSNQISDIRPLIGLTQLKFLKLADNPILDTGSLQSLYENNPDLISDTAPKIEGPWLWMIVPTDGKPGARTALSWKDWLAAASNGSVTEQQIATQGATAGERLQNRVWTLGRLAPAGGDNVGEMVNTIGLAKGTIDHHVAYGSIVLDSPREQNTRMYAGSDDNHKVWLNGELVRERLDWHWAPDYQDAFPVTLKKGKNVLLVAIQDGEGAWGGYFGFEEDTVYSIIGDTALPVAGPKIEGPWLWMIVPTEPRVEGEPAPSKDWLAAASEGTVTEKQIATKGATAGERLQNRAWALGRLTPTGGDNVGELLNTLGFGSGYRNNHVAYGSIVLDSPRKQKTRMYAGSDDNHKVWLNGKLVGERLDWHYAHDYQESFPVTLKKGKNVLLVAIQNGGSRWDGHFGFEEDTVYSVIGDTLPETAIRAERVEGGPKIEGPWLWMIAPTGKSGGAKAAASGVDYLARASRGALTEQQVAINGVTPGDEVGNKVWTLGKLSPTGEDNINAVMNTSGLGAGNIEDHVAYGSIVLGAPSEQKTWMYVGSDDAVKVWLNGTLVHNNPIDRGADDYQESFPVTLKQGKNILLVAVYELWGGWSGFFGFENSAVYRLLLPPTVHIGSAQRPPMYWIDAGAGTFHRLVGDAAETFLPRVQNATGLALEPTSRKIYWTEDTGGDTGAVKSANLDGSNVQLLATLQSVPTSIAVHAASGKLYWTNSRGRIQQANLDGQRIRNLIQDLKDPRNITVDATGGKIYWTEGEGRIRRANLNGKSVQNVAKDLESIGGIAISGNRIYWTEITGENSGKLSRANLKGSNSRTLAELQHAPCCVAVDPVGSHLYWTDTDGNIRRSNLNGETVEDVASSLASAMALVLGDVGDAPAAPLNSALVSSAAMAPNTTHLLANYPNPFNPETWIPYQLAEPTDVTVTIYDIQGRVVRHLDFGHQRAGIYQSKGRAAYWNGRNAHGEPVASGLYFYTLTAGDFSATKKMLIRK